LETEKQATTMEQWMEKCPPKLCAHLREYALLERDRWAESALQALGMVERVQFVRQDQAQQQQQQDAAATAETGPGHNNGPTPPQGSQ
jgi:hypothetical protein